MKNIKLRTLETTLESLWINGNMHTETAQR